MFNNCYYKSFKKILNFCSYSILRILLWFFAILRTFFQIIKNVEENFRFLRLNPIFYHKLIMIRENPLPEI